MADTMHKEHELQHLREQLDEAWWNEAPLCTIQQLEQEIESRKRDIKRHKDVTE